MSDHCPTSAERADQLKQYGIAQIGDVAGEPITLAQAWAHLQLDTFGSPLASDHDEWFTTIGISGARDNCEQWLGASIAPQTLELATQGFPAIVIPLLFGPVLSVVSVTYQDADNMPQTMPDTDYVLDSYNSVAVVRLVYGATWPTALAAPNSVKVRYMTGYSLPGDSPQINVLPAGIRIGLLLTLGHLFVNRENSIAGPSVGIELIPQGAYSFLERYRRRLSIA